MGNVKIAAHYTKDTRINNGLDSIQQKLREDPDGRVMVVGLVEVLDVGMSIKDGHRPYVKVNLFAIEPLSGTDATEARTIMDRAVKARTGQVVPPTLFDPPNDNQDDNQDDDQDDDGDDD